MKNCNNTIYILGLFSVYVGIATGYAKVGSIGPSEKVDFTVIDN